MMEFLYYMNDEHPELLDGLFLFIVAVSLFGLVRLAAWLWVLMGFEII